MGYGTTRRQLNKEWREAERIRKGGERLTAAAIKRGDEVLERGFTSHWQLRAALDPNDPDPRTGKPGDIEGFVTSSGRFVTRLEAIPVAVAAQQISSTWGTGSHRPLLSSDINW